MTNREQINLIEKCLAWLLALSWGSSRKKQLSPIFPMSVKGRVSRASPVHTVMRNCSKDEGGPFGFGDQEPIPSHRKLLRSKAVVVSVAETSGQ